MMGNKASYSPNDQRATRATKGAKSDDGYLPMTLAMRKAMIDGKRFQHVIPSTILLTDNEGLNNLRASSLVRTDSIRSSGSDYEAIYKLKKNVSFIPNSETHEYDSPKFNETKKPSQKSILNKTPINDFNEKSTLPHVTSSTDNIKIDQRKSKFTLQLEKRLLQSKLDLGFDTDLDSLKEFVYKYDETETKKKTTSLKRNKEDYLTKKNKNVNEPNTRTSKSKMKSGSKLDTTKRCSSKFIASVPLDENNVSNPKKNNYLDVSKLVITRSSNKMRSKQSDTVTCKPIDGQSQKRVPKRYCNHSCQILGLCSVGRPQLTKPASSLITNINDNLTDINNTFNTGSVKWKGDKHDKNDCNCELCTLAYLTDMGFPREYRSPTSTLEKFRKSSKTYARNNIISKNNDIERVRIIECGDSYKSVDISVKGSLTKKGCSTETSNECNSNLSLSTFQQDTTNQKIRRMFEQNNRSPSVNHIYRGRIESSQRREKGKVRPNELILNPRPQNKYPRLEIKSMAENVKEVPTVTSSSVLTTSVSSSISTIMSYKRVRLLFETIINKNKSRKRARKNINKFKEMEELGLGKLKNNRWYPSDDKTYTIWNNMHSNVSGVQAEFKKYPKTYVKTIP